LYRIGAASGAKKEVLKRISGAGTRAKKGRHGGPAGTTDIAGRNRMGYIAPVPITWRVSMRIRSRLALTLVLATVFAAQALAAEYLDKNERQKARAFSPGVITEGGRIVWLAAQTALQDDQGKTSPETSRARPGRSSI
jgi:hypothetical protein